MSYENASRSEGIFNNRAASILPVNNKTTAALKSNISTIDQVDQRDKKIISGMEYVSIQGQIYRYYDIPTGKGGSTVRIRIESPEWLFVRPSGAHNVIDALGVLHYIPNSFVHIGMMNADTESKSRF